MTLWRLEVLRLWRTNRWLILAGVYVFFGALGPVTARYLPQIIKSLGGGIDIQVPEMTPADGMAQYVGNAQQLGLLAVAFVAAAALAVDANTEMSIFLRTRATIRQIFVPRLVVNASAAVVGFTLGAVIAYVGTGVLLEWLPVGPVAAGVLLHGLYLVFAVSVMAVMASLLRGVVSVSITSLGVLIGLGIVSVIPPLAPWLPSELVGALDALARGGGFEYWRAVAVTVVAAPLLAAYAMARLERREV